MSNPMSAKPTSDPTSNPTPADRFFMEAMSPQFREDPYPLYNRYRGERLLQVADTIWFCLGHGDITALLRHPRLSSDESRATTKIDKARIGQVETSALKSRSLLFLDPPDHTRLRGLVARAFTPRRIDGLRAATEAIARALLDKITAQAASGPIDLIEAFA